LSIGDGVNEGDYEFTYTLTLREGSNDDWQDYYYWDDEDQYNDWEYSSDFEEVAGSFLEGEYINTVHAG